MLRKTCMQLIKRKIDKICKLYLKMLPGDAAANVLNADSLLVLNNKRLPDNFFDLVMTNPPFGSKLKIIAADILKNYDLGHIWQLRTDNQWTKTAKTKPTAPQILFIELCLKLLKPGGKMGLVLPDGILGKQVGRLYSALAV